MVIRTRLRVGEQIPEVLALLMEVAQSVVRPRTDRHRLGIPAELCKERPCISRTQRTPTWSMELLKQG